MSIATELTRIQQAKADIKTAIEAKGVTVPSSATIDTYDDYVSQISGGGGGGDATTLAKLIDRSITSIEIPSGVTSIGTNTFSYCYSLTSIDMPSGVTSIGSGAFQNCSSLSEIVIPDSVVTIGSGAFQNCSSLTSIDIPSGVTSIDSSVIRSCTSLTSITTSNNLTYIGNNAFRDCSSLTSITFNATTPPNLSSINALQNTNNCPIYVPSESVTTYQTTGNWASFSSRIQAIPNS